MAPQLHMSSILVKKIQQHVQRLPAQAEIGPSVLIIEKPVQDWDTQVDPAVQGSCRKRGKKEKSTKQSVVTGCGLRLNCRGEVKQRVQGWSQESLAATAASHHSQFDLHRMVGPVTLSKKKEGEQRRWMKNLCVKHCENCLYIVDL